MDRAVTSAVNRAGPAQTHTVGPTQTAVAKSDRRDGTGLDALTTPAIRSIWRKVPLTKNRSLALPRTPTRTTGSPRTTPNPAFLTAALLARLVAGPTEVVVAIRPPVTAGRGDAGPAPTRRNLDTGALVAGLRSRQVHPIQRRAY